MDDLVAALADHVVGCAPGSLPADVESATRTLLLDAVGCALAGLSTPESAMARAMARDSAVESGATVLGTEMRLPSQLAAFANTMAARSQLFDDTYGPGHLHAGAALTFVGLAVGEQAGLDLGDLLLAVALGAEVSSRVGAAAGEVHYAHGWHNTGTCVVFGTAATASRIMHLGAEPTRRALSLAGDHAAGLRRYQQGGSPANSALHAANAADWGIRCAGLAAAGFPAPDRMLEGPAGFFDTFSAEPDAEASVRAGLGTTWLITDASIKAYPNCRSTQGAATATQSLRTAHGVAPDDVAEVVVTVSAHAFKCDRPEPASELDAQYSIQFVVARLLVYGHLGAGDFGPDSRTDPATTNVMRRIRVVRDESLLETHTLVEMTLHDGRVLHQEIGIGEVLGDPANPLSPGQIRAKFDAGARSALPEQFADAAADLIISGAGSTPLAELTGLLRSTRARASSRS